MAYTAYQRLLIIQLDSLPWSVLKPLMAEGALPVLSKLYKDGCSGTLRSTVPPITPAAWATFMTGVPPGKHGKLNFKGFDPEQNVYRLSDGRDLQERNIYKMLSDAGSRVGVMMQPGVHPPFDLKDGFILSGFDSPGMSARFAAPEELESEIKTLCPDHQYNFNLHKFWKGEKEDPSDEAFARNLENAAEQMRRVLKLTLDLLKARPVDVLTAYFQAPDVVLHKAWRWCLPHMAADHPERRERVVEFFTEMDRICGVLLDAVPEKERLTLVVSDHGHQGAEYSVFVNTILHRHGYLRYAGAKAMVKDGFRRLKDVSKGIKRKGLGRPIDWDNSRAYMPYQACSGFIFINKKGRQPFGCVEEKGFKKIRDEIIDVLKSEMLPEKRPAFADVIAGDTFFTGADRENMPDIILIQSDGVDIKRGAGKGDGFRKREPYDGIHHPDGMYIFHGEGVAKKEDVSADIIDLPSTLLSAMGQPIPSFMEGRVLQECFDFEDVMPEQNKEWKWEDIAPPEDSAYTAEQEAQVEERLADLGYLD